MELTPSEMVALSAVRADAEYFGKCVGALQEPRNAQFASGMSMLLIPYFSLGLHEGRRKLEALLPGPPWDSLPGLSPEAESMAERSRHSLKMLEDTRLGADGVVDHLHGGIGKAHADYFYGLPKSRFLRPLVSDLGVFRYKGDAVATTQSLSFNLGMQPADIAASDFGPRLRSVAFEYGQYFGALGAKLERPAGTFVDHLDARGFSAKSENRKSQRFYRKLFGEDLNPRYSPTLMLLLCHANFAESVLNASFDFDSTDYPILKMRFLTIYGVVRSLKQLARLPSTELGARSSGVVRSLSRDPAVAAVASKRMRRLRNSLIHYQPDPNTEVRTSDSDTLAAIVVDAALPADDLGALAERIRLATEHVATGLNAWTQ